MPKTIRLKKRSRNRQKKIYTKKRITKYIGGTGPYSINLYQTIDNLRTADDVADIDEIENKLDELKYDLTRIIYRICVTIAYIDDNSSLNVNKKTAAYNDIKAFLSVLYQLHSKNSNIRSYESVLETLSFIVQLLVKGHCGKFPDIQLDLGNVFMGITLVDSYDNQELIFNYPSQKKYVATNGRFIVPNRWFGVIKRENNAGAAAAVTEIPDDIFNMIYNKYVFDVLKTKLCRLLIGEDNVDPTVLDICNTQIIAANKFITEQKVSNIFDNNYKVAITQIVKQHDERLKELYMDIYTGMNVNHGPNRYNNSWGN